MREKPYSKFHATKPSREPFQDGNEDTDESRHPVLPRLRRKTCNAQIWVCALDKWDDNKCPSMPLRRISSHQNASPCTAKRDNKSQSWAVPYVNCRTQCYLELAVFGHDHLRFPDAAGTHSIPHF